MSNELTAVHKSSSGVITVFQKDPDLEQEVRDMLCSGWSPHQVCVHMSRYRNLKFSVVDIEHYLETIPTDEILNLPSLADKFGKVSVKIDPIEDMGRLIKLSEERLMTAKLAEDVSTEVESPKDKGSVTNLVSVLMNEHFNMLKDYINVMQSVGMLPKRAEKIDITHGLPTLRDIMENGEIN